ncbi:Hsp20/alpha crystallin family protein [Candidatus Falkowbacteria bacterium]|nr:Hsp20/alpha crystallin family protein [Candidatus Falkowbacteria bacterium]
MDKKIFFTNLDDLKENLELTEGSSKAPVRHTQEWFTQDFEGQLTIDVFQTDKDIVVQSTIAGVEPEDLEIFLHDDMLTIRGRRQQTKEQKSADYFYKECYWGGFSRSIILPVDVNPEAIDATIKNGLLTIRLPKLERTKTVNIKVKKH